MFAGCVDNYNYHNNLEDKKMKYNNYKFGTTGWGLFSFYLLFLLSISLFAQKTPPPFLAAYSEGETYIILVDIPSEMTGFNIYCEKDGKFEKLNKEPVKPIKDPLMFREELGDDYYWVAKALDATNAIQTLRRIEGDPGTGFALSLASLKVAKASGRLFIDTTAVEGKRCTYKVAYLDYDGKEFSSKESKVRLVEKKPEPPEEMNLKSGDGEVEIKWEYPPFTGKPDDITTGFNIYRKGDNEKKIKRINDLTILRQEGHLNRFDRDVINGVRYTYYVTALDFAGRESVPSEKAIAEPEDKTSPLIPEQIRTIREEGKITITWRMNLELDLSHYNIFKAEEVQGEFSKLNSKPIPGDRPYYTDTAVSYKQYFYKLEAVDKNGNKSKLSGAISGRCKDETPPSPPKEISCIVDKDEHTVTLRWESSIDAELLGCHVYRGEKEDELFRISKELIKKDDNTYFDSGYGKKGLTPGKTYYYGVSAFDNAMNESKIKPISVKIPDNVPPLAPLTCYAKNIGDGTVEVQWQRSPSLDASSHRLYKGKEEEELSLVKEMGKEEATYIDKDLEKGKTYIYAVSAVDSAGNEGKKSERFSVTVRDMKFPPVPSDVKVKVTGKGVKITWKEVTAEDLAGYNVYRSNLLTGVFKKLNKEVLRKTIFIDKNGKEGLYYRITTLDTSGNENEKAKPVEAEKGSD
jgi:fibronectin type 3 domain-containing protein